MNAFVRDIFAALGIPEVSHDNYPSKQILTLMVLGLINKKSHRRRWAEWDRTRLEVVQALKAESYEKSDAGDLLAILKRREMSSKK